MSRLRFCLTAVIVAAFMSSSAFAQTPASPPAAKPAPAAATADAPKPSTTAQVEKWTKRQWETAKKEWAKDKKKWSDCQKQSKDQKLDGRKSWSFLYTCMKS